MMLSFRTKGEEAEEAKRWSDRLGIHRSQLLRDALRMHLNRLASEDDAVALTDVCLDEGQRSFMTVADWGPVEDWSDWTTSVDER
jgi:hypothetical protein